MKDELVEKIKSLSLEGLRQANDWRKDEDRKMEILAEKAKPLIDSLSSYFNPHPEVFTFLEIEKYPNNFHWKLGYNYAKFYFKIKFPNDKELEFKSLFVNENNEEFIFKVDDNKKERLIFLCNIDNKEKIVDPVEVNDIFLDEIIDSILN